MANTTLHLECGSLPGGFRVLRADGVERMNALTSFSVALLTPEPAVSTDLVGAAATVTMLDEGEGTTRSIGLVITAVAHVGVGKDGNVYELTLAPPHWALTKKAGYRVFLGKSTKEIVEQVLTDAGFTSDGLVWRLQGTYSPRLQCIQYDESDWDFIERLLADEGIAYWFDFVEGTGPQLVFGDGAKSHESIVSPYVVPFGDPSGMLGRRGFFELESNAAVVGDAVHVREYDVRQPNVFIDGKAGTGKLEYFEYPSAVLDADAASRRAKVRLEQLQRLAAWVDGASDCARIQPGRVLDVDGCSDTALDRRYIVIKVEHRFVIGHRQFNEGRPYANSVSMVPSVEATFRPSIPETAPRVEGIETAMTTGSGGEEIHVDDLARVKVRFLWDRSGITDDKSSEWTRCLQMGMGGSMLLPRVGWEVPIMYIDGDPDRPFVLGRVYNATAIVPYALPGGKSTTTLQSATSPGGGSTNELRMGDAAGGMEMFIHASKDQTVSVGGSATTKVGVDATHDVALSQSFFITGSHTHTVGANQNVNVVTDFAIASKGSRSESIGGMEKIDVTGNRYVAANGAYSELVGAAYLIQCNQANYDVKGAFTQLIGGSFVNTAGMTTGESVAAARTELVAGGRSILAATGVADSTIGIKTVTAGATNETAGGKVVTTGKAAASTVVGGSINFKASANLVIDAPSITITVAGPLKAKALEIGGGTLKAKKGTTTFKGKVTRKGGTELK